MNTNAFPDRIIQTIADLSVEAERKAKSLQAEANEVARVQKMWDDLHSFLHKRWSLHVLDLMDRETILLKKLRAENHPAMPVLDEVYQAAKDEANTVRRRFPAYLEEACNSNKLPIDRESRHPRYSFERGFLKLEVDDRKGVARLTDHEGRLDEFPADIGAIVKVVQREHTRIFGRLFDGDKFLKKLRRQYLAVIKKLGKSDGTSVPIRHITRRLGKNEKGFRTDEFLVDLSRLVEQGPIEIDGRRLDLQQTKDTNQGMLLIGAAGRGYIGFIIFKEV
jgi:hypothetical protein